MNRLQIRLDDYLKLVDEDYHLIQNRILLVGDKPGNAAPIEPGYHHTPFHSMKNCSGYLNILLDEYGIDERELIWINAISNRSVENPNHYLGAEKYLVERYEMGIDIVSRLNPRAIIALGNLASRWLRDIPHEKQPHPQYWTRFHSKKEYPLLPLLKRLLS